MTSKASVGPVSLWVMFVALGITGCAQATGSVESYDPQSHRGELDPSLPVDARQRQAVVKTVFDSLMPFNFHFEELPAALPGIQMAETKQSFLDGKGALYGWAFDGAPRGNEIPVIVYLEEDATGRPSGQQARTYVVTGGAGRWTVSRKR
jgi:hypothetical protein